MAVKQHKFVVVYSVDEMEVCYYLNGKMIDPCGAILGGNTDVLAALTQYGIEAIPTKAHMYGTESLQEVLDFNKEAERAPKLANDLKQKYNDIEAKIQKLREERGEIEDKLMELEDNFGVNPDN